MSPCHILRSAGRTRCLGGLLIADPCLKVKDNVRLWVSSMVLLLYIGFCHSVDNDRTFHILLCFKRLDMVWVKSELIIKKCFCQLTALLTEAVRPHSWFLSVSKKNFKASIADFRLWLLHYHILTAKIMAPLDNKARCAVCFSCSA